MARNRSEQGPSVPPEASPPEATAPTEPVPTPVPGRDRADLHAALEPLWNQFVAAIDHARKHYDAIVREVQARPGVARIHGVLPLLEAVADRDGHVPHIDRDERLGVPPTFLGALELASSLLSTKAPTLEHAVAFRRRVELLAEVDHAHEIVAIEGGRRPA